MVADSTGINRIISLWYICRESQIWRKRQRNWQSFWMDIIKNKNIEIQKKRESRWNFYGVLSALSFGF